jgi:hypothetical protein
VKPGDEATMENVTCLKQQLLVKFDLKPLPPQQLKLSAPPTEVTTDLSVIAAGVPGTCLEVQSTGSGLSVNRYPVPGVLIDEESGEVLNPEMIPELLGLTAEEILGLGWTPESFAITDQITADWFVARIRRRQTRVECIAEMASAAIRDELKAMAGLMYKYGVQLRVFCESKLERKKDGKFRAKNVKFNEGAVHFKKSGGVKCVDRELLQDMVSKLPTYEQKYRIALENILDFVKAKNVNPANEILRLAQDALLWKSPLDNLPVKLEPKFDVRDMTKLQTQMLAAEGPPQMLPGYADYPINETAQMVIGGQKPWSMNKVAGVLKSIDFDKFKPLLQGAESEEDVIEAEVKES